MRDLATTLLADSWPFHHNLGTGGWIAMVLGMIVFWGVVVALVVVLGRGILASRSDTPEDILRRRLAQGEVSIEEYERRRAALDPPIATSGTNDDPPRATGGPTTTSPSPSN